MLVRKELNRLYGIKAMRVRLSELRDQTLQRVSGNQNSIKNVMRMFDQNARNLELQRIRHEKNLNWLMHNPQGRFTKNIMRR